MLWEKTTPFDGSGFCTLTPVKPICTKIASRSNFNVFQIKGSFLSQNLIIFRGKDEL
jgi:hypothetical protein